MFCHILTVRMHLTIPLSVFCSSGTRAAGFPHFLAVVAQNIHRAFHKNGTASFPPSGAPAPVSVCVSDAIIQLQTRRGQQNKPPVSLPQRKSPDTVSVLYCALAITYLHCNDICPCTLL